MSNREDRVVESWPAALPALRDALQGPACTRDTPGYAAEVSVFNTAVQHRPAIAVGAATAADVVAAVSFASRHDLDIAVLNTGHGPSVEADHSTLMITTRRMRGIAIDSSRRTARVEAGVRFDQLVRAAARYGLAPLPGSAPGVGVVGYTLSGGASSTMGRKFGWAADHVRRIDVVTADGELREVSPRREADLFGALLGGRSNFGVVTAMEFNLFPVTQLYAGAIFYSGAHIEKVMDVYRTLTATAPDELTTSLAVLNLPPLPGLPPFMQGRLTLSVRVSYLGDANSGGVAIEPLRQAAPVLADTVAEIPYSEFGSISNGPTDPAAAVEQFGLLRELAPETVSAVVDVIGPRSASSINIVDFRHLGGAFSKPAPVLNSVGARDAAFAVFGLTVVPPGHNVVDYAQAGGALFEALRPWLYDGASPSFQGPKDTTEERTRQAYEPDVYGRLRSVKTKYDPHNRFRLNHNIPPYIGYQ